MDRIGLHETAEQNSESFLRALTSHASVGDFLTNASTYIPIMSTNMTKVEQHAMLQTECDIDGMVLEIETLSGLKLKCRKMHLDVSKNTVPVFHLLKKHLHLSSYSALALNQLKTCKGLCLFRECGWEVLLTFTPNTNLTPGDQFLFAEFQKSSVLFHSFKEKVETRFNSANSRDKNRPTLLKNSLSDTRFWDVLPADLPYVLSVLDLALQDLEERMPRCLQRMIFICQFGQKEQNAVDLKEIVHTELLQTFTVHSAVSLNLRAINTYFFWARFGIQQLLKRRGTIFPAYTFVEACNYNTNTDTNEMDVSVDLRNVSKFPTKITFLQMYAETPHRHTKSSPHPVSGSIVTCGVLHPQTTQRLRRESRAYLDTYADSIGKMQHPCNARIEIVTRLSVEDLESLVVDPCEMSDPTNLSNLLNDFPLVLPFFDDPAAKPSFSTAIKSVPSHLLGELETLLRTDCGKGGLLGSWKAFQLEMALEKFFSGRTRSPLDKQLSINLGPGSDQLVDRSVSSARGFLALENPLSSAAGENAPPPLAIWTHNTIEQQRIVRIFTFSDVLVGSFGVVGEKFLHCLLADLCRPDLRPADFLLALKSPRSPRWSKVVHGQTIHMFAEELSEQVKRMRYPFVSQMASKMVLDKNLDIKTVIREGLKDLHLRFFPKIQTYDETRNAKVRWNSVNVVQLFTQAGEKSDETTEAEVTRDVLSQLVHKRLCYQTTLKPLENLNKLPWMSQVLRKLRGQSSDPEQLVKCCCYVTCVAMLQNGMFIDFNQLSKLDSELGSIKSRMRQLEIFSSFQLSGINKPTVYRLHPSVPCRLPTPTVEAKAPVKRRPDIPDEEQTADALLDVEETVEEQTVTFLPQRHVPTCVSRKQWSTRELAIVKQLGSLRSRKEAYTQYVVKCLQGQIPYHGFREFVKKCDSSDT